MIYFSIIITIIDRTFRHFNSCIKTEQILFLQWNSKNKNVGSRNTFLKILK